ncbi:alkylation response protein AidB-like acyl-CoA dehydrogenase [Neorhizobium galegae]|uniref:acyl-CoA dehydrogenase family protein n=1 Tax=Neorhizobium galegae TaxID=399 RepID=UPI001AE52A87|nr:acyl-CoA dehydrogenase family protein [Neorhizobium galegae]MBP2548942.1 alkylation response protein AidB-like acyl-CoA dehydrogenase [Neorhizobium galegae]
MTDIANAWGAAPSERFDAIASRFRPIFADIHAGAIERDLARTLPFAEYRRLKDAGFSVLRLPEEIGGAELTLPELFGLLIELAEADPNLTNAYRSHLGFTEDLLNAPPGDWRDRWLLKLAAGETIGSGFSEIGNAPLGSYSTQLIRNGDHWLLNGQKFYTTGSLYADWITLGAVDGDGHPIGALVPTRAAGVEIIDDWDGFGQSLTASGTARFADVEISNDLIKPSALRFSYSGGFFQLVHLASLAGIGRAAATEVAGLVAERRRVYARSNATLPGEDPQILQVVGRVRSAAYAAGAIVLKAADALQRAHAANLTGDTEAIARANRDAELEVSQSVTVVSSLILEATTILFDALGASAAKKSHGLDRHWRNARTITSHNPRIYHDRVVGDFAINGTLPSPQVGVGIHPEREKAKA